MTIIDPNIKLIACNGSPNGTEDSILIRPDAVVRNVFPLSRIYEGFNTDVIDISGSGDNVVNYEYYEVLGKEIGKPYKTNDRQVWI